MSQPRYPSYEPPDPYQDTPEPWVQNQTEWERDRAAEASTLAEPHPERFSVEAAENGDYPALCGDQDCKPCEASGAAWAAEREAVAAEEAQASALMESHWPEYEAEASS